MGPVSCPSERGESLSFFAIAPPGSKRTAMPVKRRLPAAFTPGAGDTRTRTSPESPPFFRPLLPFAAAAAAAPAATVASSGGSTSANAPKNALPRKMARVPEGKSLVAFTTPAGRSRSRGSSPGLDRSVTCNGYGTGVTANRFWMLPSMCFTSPSQRRHSSMICTLPSWIPFWVRSVCTAELESLCHWLSLDELCGTTSGSPPSTRGVITVSFASLTPTTRAS
mmetsp:Transcript_18514/g.60287  ORF Transcript_18514/g.60287 Transcript_18514/m.60287 type:complete len:223 (+) Transcript_18514:1091-1759(+)